MYFVFVIILACIDLRRSVQCNTGLVDRIVVQSKCIATFYSEINQVMKIIRISVGISIVVKNIEVKFNDFFFRIL